MRNRTISVGPCNVPDKGDFYMNDVTRLFSVSPGLNRNWLPKMDMLFNCIRALHAGIFAS